ncbi:MULTISPECIES: sporulation protein [unclassified Streptomyces]|uniref:sporulation protein n=1 Tax=unclassified Streptomyces TaxID=2593676 RepID=UPI0022512133|nr:MULTISPECIES: sporulation protein [unclassified Streptomyces]WSP56447.1 sporulation protein [Streptomyces sp. NBC_01241]WSU22836.1 sporulation protein [Streptomyces sp. NBC_01108]MCX4788182.1 sporulation protein [Streptomyces sp. NBC_01221]MCX4796061.1 sporulation protein [Streptomyces sp. NBC_01242]WSJ37324.1 sporulation protein [Streptomyces sp. NBC_01321]
MSREQRGPNEKLGTVLALAGISNAGLARRVNDLGAQRGLTLRYDKTSVARWVSKGMVPQGAAPHLIAAAIGAKLGRPVPLHEIGLADADPAPEVGLAFPRDVAEAVRSATELYRLDLAGRRAGSGGIWQSLAGSFSVSAYATPASRWLISPADPSVERDSTAAEAAVLGTPGARGARTGAGAQRAPAATGESAEAEPGIPGTTAVPGMAGAPVTQTALNARAAQAALGTLGAMGTKQTPSIPAQPGPESTSTPSFTSPAAVSPAAPVGPVTSDISPLRVGHSDVSKLREAAQDARRWDSKYGGGDWRSSMVPECLRVDAAPLLLGSYSDEVGRALFGAAAELTRLAGWMAFDTGQQEAAQRYYIQALRLARAAADVPLGGYVLASMSLQATYRGFADEGVDLAQAAVERNRGLATARTMSFFRLVEARAHAKASDAAAAGAALKAAEGWLERSRDGDADPSWLGFYSYDRFAADAAECHLDLKAPRQVRRFTEQALSRPTEEFVRSHGLRLVVSAVAELESGNLDAACAAGTRAVEVAGRISSARTTEYVRDLLHRLEPYGHEPRVAELRERARPLLVAPV